MWKWLTFFLGISLGAAAAETPILEDLQARSLRYFLDHSNPRTGLVRDRANNFGDTDSLPQYRSASLAATGFGLAAQAHAAATGKLRRNTVETRVARTLEFVRDNLHHHRGWLYHFVDWETGERFGKNEVSTIDTALFLAGAIYAAEIFPNSRAAKLARELYERVDFPDMMTDGGAKPEKRTLSMGWLPEEGYLKAQWDSYAEHTLLVLLGLGHPKKPLPKETWSAWKRPFTGEVMGGDLPLFVHQYSHLFVDFRDFPDKTDFFANSVRATQLERARCQRIAAETYRAGFWGRSASDGPKGYQAYSPVIDDATVCPGCAGASIIFAPDEVREDLQRWARGPYREKIFGRYGFIDALNLDQAWFGKDVLGITVGALYLAMANLEKENIWSRMSFQASKSRLPKLTCRDIFGH